VATVVVPFTNEAWRLYLKRWKLARNAMIGSASLTLLYLLVFRAQPEWIAIFGLCCFLVALGMAIQNEIANMCGVSLRPDDQAATISRAHLTYVADAEHRLAAFVQV
jgi:4-hydroxybenzoate polyprenyltransferase